MTNETIVNPEKMKLGIVEAVEQALTSINAFGALLIRETQALREVDHDAVADLQDDKIASAAEYHEWIMLLTNRKEEMRGLPKSMKDRLSDTYKNFAKATDENRRTLLHSKEVAQRIEKLIIKAAKKTVDAAPNYDKNAYYGAPKDRAINFNVNQTL